MIRPLLVSEGQSWEGMKSFQVQKSMDKAQHSFTMSTTDRFQAGLDRWNIRGGSEVQFYIDRNLVFSGFCQKYKPSVSSDSHQITISGQSKAIDVVQSSHDGNYFWKNTPSEAVIEELLEPFGFEFSSSKPLKAIGSTGFRIGVNESPFSAIKRIAERNGLLVFTDNDGNFKLSDTSDQLFFSEIGRGDYVRISADHDVSKSFSNIIVKGQRNSYDFDFDTSQQNENRLLNSSQPRHRPKVVVVTAQESEQENISKLIQRRLTGDSVKANVTVKSPYDSNGNLWGIGNHVWVREELVDLDHELVISDLDFSLSENSGFEANLTLKIPETYTIDPSKVFTARRSTGIFGDLLKAFL